MGVENRRARRTDRDMTDNMEVESSTMAVKEEKSISIIYSLTEAVGALAESLKIFKKHQVNLLHIESRSSIKVPGYEFMVELDSANKFVLRFYYYISIIPLVPSIMIPHHSIAMLSHFSIPTAATAMIHHSIILTAT